MKLKYYMRGLGIGIILTTLILSINNPKEKLTDEEIIARAEDLGMMMKNESNGALDKVLSSLKPSPTEPVVAGDTENNEEAQPPTETAPTETLSPTESPEATEPPKVTEPPTQTPAETEDKDTQGQDASSDTYTVNVEVTSGLDDQVTIIVKNGMSAKQVSLLLEQYGIVDDAMKFNDYVVERKKAEHIRVGTYTFTKGADYDEIVTLLTKSQ